MLSYRSNGDVGVIIIIIIVIIIIRVMFTGIPCFGLQAGISQSVCRKRLRLWLAKRRKAIVCRGSQGPEQGL